MTKKKISSRHEIIRITLPIGCGPDGMQQAFHTLEFIVPIDDTKIVKSVPINGFRQSKRPKTLFKTGRARENKKLFLTTDK